jgi:hypothetical protein
LKKFGFLKVSKRGERRKTVKLRKVSKKQNTNDE